MRRPVVLTIALTLAIVAGGCNGEPDDDPASTAPDTPVPTAEPTATDDPTTPDPTTTPSTADPTEDPTEDPAAGGPCDPTTALAVVGDAVEDARLAPVTAWVEAGATTGLAERSTTGDAFADRLGLECGVRRSEDVGDDHRVVLAAWSGPRMAWVVQTTETPATPYSQEATVTVLIDVIEGEFLDGDGRSLWAGTADDGVSFVIGHVDFNLGVTAKSWLVEEPPVDEVETSLPAERHAVRALREAGMDEIGIAEPAEIGSEEGHVMFVSTTGQISVADVAPTDWFDPTAPRYLGGPTRVEVVDGIEVRITEPASGEFAVAAEVAFACDGFAWLLQPPLNGTTDEAVATATAVLATAECRPG